jgi:hypothetical protein
MGRPESVVNWSLRSLRCESGNLGVVMGQRFAHMRTVEHLGLRPATTRRRPPGKATATKGGSARVLAASHIFRARRKEVTAKKMNRPTTVAARAMIHGATSRVQARKREFSQATARTANRAPTASWKSCFSARHRRLKPRRGGSTVWTEVATGTV